MLAGLRGRTARASAAMISLRPAIPSDHAHYARLFPQLIDDPILDAGRWEEELMPHSLMAELDGVVAGYAYGQLLGRTAFVRHVVVASEARRRGVGRAMFVELLARARAARCAELCLNVRPTNDAAIALYASFGRQPVFTTIVQRVPWAAVEAAPPHAEDIAPGVVEPEDDAAIESRFAVTKGLFADARAKGRVLALVRERGAVVAACIFDPAFPIAHALRVARPELAIALLLALRPHVLRTHDHLQVVTDDAPDVVEMLAGLGATERLRTVRYAVTFPA